MEIDPVTADADRVAERLGAFRAQRIRDVLLEDREFRAQAPRLADVGRRREAIGRSADDVTAKPQSGIADSAVSPWRLGLQPIEQAQAELSRGLEVSRALGQIDAYNRAE